MGAAVRIPVIEAGKMPEAIALLREKGITCLAAALYQSQPLSAAASSYPDGVCVVIGSEGQASPMRPSPPAPALSASP